MQNLIYLFFTRGVSEKEVLNLSPVCNQLLYNINSIICSSLRNKRNASVSPVHISCCSQIWQAEHSSSTSCNWRWRKSEDDMKWETKCRIYLSISCILRGDLPELPLDTVLVCKMHQEHIWKHKYTVASLFSLCLCLLSRDNLSFQLLSSSIQPRGAIPLWKIFFLTSFSLPFFLTSTLISQCNYLIYTHS